MDKGANYVKPCSRARCLYAVAKVLQRMADCSGRIGLQEADLDRLVINFDDRLRRFPREPEYGQVLPIALGLRPSANS